MNRSEVLDTAKELITQNREAEYGSPHANLNCANYLIKAYLDYANKVDVCVIMALVKIARIATGEYKPDNYIDAAGYLALGCEMGGQIE